MNFFALLLLIMSFILFFMMGSDKNRARQKRRRIPELRLFLIALLGGAAGGLIGMYVFHHKTKHWYFVWGFWLLTLIQLAALCLLILRE